MTGPAAAFVPRVGDRPTATQTPLARHADDAVQAELRLVDGREVSWFRIAGGKRHGAIGLAGAQTAVRAVRMAISLGVPVVGVLDTGGADIHEGVTALHGWGLLAHAFADASGVVPTIVAVTGACVSGPALVLGLVDAVVMTEPSFAYVTGPDAVAEVTGVATTRHDLGGATVHGTVSGVATLVVADETHVDAAIADLLACLPSNNVNDPPREVTGDDPQRDCITAAGCVPAAPNAPYDVRDVIDDVLDADSFLELRPHHAPNIVIGFGRLDGFVVGVIANQPSSRAGTIDIDASRKAARFVSWCDSFNVPLLTLRRYTGLRARPRSRMARHDPPRCAARARLLPRRRFPASA